MCSRKRNPDVAGQEETSSTDLVSTGNDPMERIESKIDILLSSVQSLVEAIGGVNNVKEEKTTPERNTPLVLV